MPQQAFMVHAVNMQEGTSNTYGPFPGVPHMTYTFIRCVGHDDLMPPDDHIFVWQDNDHLEEADPNDGYPPATEGWVGDSGTFIASGWRRCFHTTDPNDPRRGNFGVPAGPFWSDLTFQIGSVADDYHWGREANEMPADGVETHENNPLTREAYLNAGGYSHFSGEW